MNKLKAALIGIGGIGKMHARIISELAVENKLECIAFAELNMSDNQDSFDLLKSLGAKPYKDYQQMLKAHPDIDFVIIATPISTHKAMACHVLKEGFHVMLEKPPAAVIQDFDEIIEAQRDSGKYCAVHFQNTSGKAFRQLLVELNKGTIGSLESIAGVGIWKRTRQYYERTPWAGKFSHNGVYVLDGTMINPLAHLLHNCLVAAGYGSASSTQPVSIQAELYKAHPIESEDTSAVRIHTQNGVDVSFYATLCAMENEIPYMLLRGSQGEMKWSYQNDLFIEQNDGQRHTYNYNKENLFKNVYINLMDVILEKTEMLYSPLEDCRPFMLSVNGAFESSGKTHKITDRYIQKKCIGDDETVYIAGIEQLLKSAAEQRKLLSELDVPWSSATKPFNLAGYSTFKL